MKPRNRYRDFLRCKVNSKHIEPYYKYVLGENFASKYYVTIVQTAEFGLKNSLLIIIENVENSYNIEFSTKINDDGYVLASKRRLKNQLPKELYDFFIENGLNIDYEVGLNGMSDFLVHRLVACLYYNILGLEIHHYNYLSTCNHIWNLQPVEPKIHDEWKKLDRDKEFYLAEEKEIEMKKRYFDREYRSKGNNNVVDILKLKEDWDEEE